MRQKAWRGIVLGIVIIGSIVNTSAIPTIDKDLKRQRHTSIQPSLPHHLTLQTNLWFDLNEMKNINNQSILRINNVEFISSIRSQSLKKWNYTSFEKTHTFSLKFQLPKYGEVTYTPLYLPNNILPTPNHQRFYQYSTSKNNSAAERSTIENLNDSLVIYAPQLVAYDWNQIPSPHRSVVDGIMLNNKAAKGIIQNIYLEAPRKAMKIRAETKKWTYGGNEVVQLSQAFFENWVKGGEQSVALLSDLRVNANYKHKKLEWDNKVLHKLGIISQEDQRTRINDDVIQMTSKLGMNASKKWYYSTMLDFKTQFFYGRDAKEYDRILSGFMSPGYQTFAIGMDYKPKKNFSILISPLTSKITYVLDTVNVDASRYNIPEGKRTDAQTGASLTSNIIHKISPVFTLTSNFDYFYSYLDDEAKSQLEWEIIFDMRINKYLSTRLVPHMRYFQNESEKIQFRQNLTIAFNYTF